MSKYFEVVVEIEVATLKNGNPKLKKKFTWLMHNQ